MNFVIVLTCKTGEVYRDTYRNAAQVERIMDSYFRRRNVRSAVLWEVNEHGQEFLLEEIINS